MAEPKRVTITEIAAAAGVSISTVSRVLRGSAPVAEDKRQAVLAAVKALDYRPNIFAQGLASGESRIVGVVTQNVSSPFYDAILRGVLQGLEAGPYSPLFADGYWQAPRERQALQLLLEHRVEGLIVLGGASPEEELAAIAETTPLVLVGRNAEAVPCLRFDDFRGGYLATQYLIQCGHRRIAHIAGLLSHEDAVCRREGYQRALADAELEADPDLEIEGDFTEASGLLAVGMLLGQQRTFSAIFCGNDQMAYGARLALFRHGLRVPDDVSVIGFDDQPLSAFTTPPLTTVRQPAMAIGLEAAQVLLRLLDGEDPNLKTFAAELVVRESVARLR